MSDDGIVDEPVECTGCGEQPSLFYTPMSDETWQLRCGCDLSAVGVDESLSESSLIEPITGKWSNHDFKSKVDD